MSVALRLVTTVIAGVLVAGFLVTSCAVVVEDQNEIDTAEQQPSVLDEGSLTSAEELDDAEGSLGAGFVSPAESQESVCDEFWCERCRVCVPTARDCRLIVCPEL